MACVGDVRHSLQGRLKNASASRGRTDGIRLTLRSSTGEWQISIVFVSFAPLYITFYFLHLLYLCILCSLSGLNIESLDIIVLLSCCPAPPLKLIDLPGLDSRSSSDDSPVSKIPLQFSPFQFEMPCYPSDLLIFHIDMLNTSCFAAHKVKSVDYFGY